jgi:hypothetical protein
MFGCLNWLTGFQNVREVQGAFCKKIAKEFRFSAEKHPVCERQGEIPLQFTCLWRVSLGSKAWISPVGAFVSRHCQPRPG